MAVPGFSVSDLLVAIAQTKQVYDAFFDKHRNAASQLHQLSEEINDFRTKMQTHQRIIERHGLAPSTYNAVKRTLTECDEFLEKYKSALDKKYSAAGAFRTTRFAFVQDDVTRLQNQIARHRQDIMFDSMNILVDNSFQRNSVGVSTGSAQPVTIQNTYPTSISPSPTPPQPYQSPTLVANGFLSTSPVIGGYSPRMRPQPTSSNGSPRSPITSPRLSPQMERAQQSRQSTVDTLILPQAALPYVLVTFNFNDKRIDLKRKPAGRNFDGGREFIIFDEFAKPRFAHKVKLPPSKSCYPYTWHRRWEDRGLEVTFKGPPDEAHSLILKGKVTSSGTPRYKFTKHEDYCDFQSQVRGKELISYYDIRQIKAGSLPKHREATDQHLKIWKDKGTQEHSISFYASAADNPTDLEFPILMFAQDFKGKDVFIDLEFTIATESTTKRKMSRRFSRSPTARSNSGSVSGAPSVFSSRTLTGFTATTAATTVIDSGMSIASFESDSSLSEQRPSMLSPLQIHAKQLRCLSVEFSDPDDIERFETEWQRIYKEDLARPTATDLFSNWQMDAMAQTYEVAASGPSEPGTPGRQFAMTPMFELDGNTRAEMG